MASLIITIDGPAASGKSTAARLLAKKLDAAFLDTGAMYRAVTLAAINDGADLSQESELLKVLSDNEICFDAENDQMTVKINGIDVTEDIRLPEVTAKTHYIASSGKIREKLVAMQREFASLHEKIVTEGRDQGTVAFADAKLKFFLVASAEERAKRRYKDLQNNSKELSFEQIQASIEKRDKMDESRSISPLKPAEDAIVVDTTNLSIDQVVNKLIFYVNKDG
jgi:cytidylate kinase